MKKRVTHDFETRSEVDLKKVGAFKYSLHHSTIPTCFAFKAWHEPTLYFLDFHTINRPWKKQDPRLRKAWTRYITEVFQFSAHNDFFERCIYTNILVKRYGWPKIPPRQRRCTAAKAAACSLPRALEKAGEALNLRVQKDKRGSIAMRATMQPTQAWKKWQKKLSEINIRRGLHQPLTAHQQKWIDAGNIENKPPKFRTPESHPEIFEDLYRYNKIDVLAEEALDKALPDLLPEEQQIWFHNQMLNWRGLPVDMPVIKKIVEIIEVENKTKRKELDKLTAGLISKPGAIKSILEFLQLQGVKLPNLRKNTVDEQLESFMIGDEPRKLLELRKALSMASTKKYHSFLQRACDDGRIRDITLYHGAHTGRDTGTGIQPHNFPRGLIKTDWNAPYQHVEIVEAENHEWLTFIYGDTLPVVFSGILRNMIIPEAEHELFVADFAKIEVAVLWWLAGNKDGLEILRRKLSPYKYQAAHNTGKDYDETADDGDEYQLAKAQVLGCGFGMGWAKFQMTAEEQYRIKLTSKQSKEAVLLYREANEAVPALWKTYERAAIDAVKTGRTVKAGKCKFIFDPEKRYGRARILWIELPSGRRLAYVNPQIAWRVRQYEVRVTKMVKGKEVTKIEIKTAKPAETLEYFGVNSKTKKWELLRTWGGTLAENVTQAVARDLMMPGLVRLEKIGFKGLLAVHDEGICQAPISDARTVADFVECLCRSPAWASGLPISASGWKGPRYMKR